jgi:hypothetical protein
LVSWGVVQTIRSLVMEGPFHELLVARARTSGGRRTLPPERRCGEAPSGAAAVRPATGAAGQQGLGYEDAAGATRE